MSKNLYLCVPDPFDSSTGARLERMGINAGFCADLRRLIF